MDNVVNTNEVDIDYTLIYKDKQNILHDINFEDDNDRLICSAIIDNLERQLADNIKIGNTVSIPFVGTIERNWYKMAIKDNYQDFRDYKASHTKEEYDEFYKIIKKELLPQDFEIWDDRRKSDFIYQKVYEIKANTVDNSKKGFASKLLNFKEQKPYFRMNRLKKDIKITNVFMEMNSEGEVSIKGAYDISEYTDVSIFIITREYFLDIKGSNLKLRTYSKSITGICGEIGNISFMKR